MIVSIVLAILRSRWGPWMAAHLATLLCFAAVIG